MAMYRQGKTHSPIIMQSVKSTQVQKPVLQMAGAVAPGPASPSDLVGPSVLPGGPGALPGGHGVLPGGHGVLPGGAGGAYRGVATPVTVPPPPPSYAVTVIHDHSTSNSFVLTTLPLLLLLFTFTFSPITLMPTILPGVLAAACREQPANANTPARPKSGPNNLPTLLQRLNTGKTGSSSPWLVPCPGTDTA